MRIEYEDRDIIVIYKESGLPVQTARTVKKDLVSLLKNHLAKQSREDALKEAGSGKARSGMGAAGAGINTGGTVQKERTGNVQIQRNNPPAEPYLGIVHRLDQPVEGLLVFAKTPKSAANLSRQAAAKDTMEKIYLACVCLGRESYPLALEARKRDVILTDWIRRDTRTNMAVGASEGERDAKRAELVLRTIGIRDSLAVVEVQLHTGRHHQIRYQLAHAGMPILGDRKYGPDDPQEGAGGQLCLSACRLSFIHPSTGRKMQFGIDPAWLRGDAKNVSINH